MVLRDWIFNSEQVASAISARVATPDTKERQQIAEIATIALASGENKEKEAIIGVVSGKAITEKTDPAPALPIWCREDCHYYDAIPGAGSGCILALADGPWQEEWRRLDTMATCPKQLQ